MSTLDKGSNGVKGFQGTKAVSNPALESLANKLIERLRAELSAYGGLLDTLELQHQSILSRAADRILISTQAVNEQNSFAQQARKDREGCQTEISRLLVQPADVPLTGLVNFFPDKFRPGVSALMHENTSLLQRVQSRVRQNQVMLDHSLKMMRDLMSELGGERAAA